MGLLIFFALISILLSFICSILEAVLLSVTPTFVSAKIQEKKTFARKLESLKHDIDQPLIAILTLNTIAHTVGAILVGVHAERAYAELFPGSENRPGPLGITEDAFVGYVSAIMTFLILVVSEIIPKTIGARFWKELAAPSATLLQLMVAFLKYTGLLWVLRLFTRLIGKSGIHGSVLSREEITVMTEIAEEEGVMEESESRVIRNMLRFDSIYARDIMTPRTVMTIADAQQTIQEFYDQFPAIPYSRIPVYSGTPDHFIGYVLRTQVLENLLNEGGGRRLKEISRELLVTDRDTPMPILFETLISRKEHISLVVDEYGSVSGLLTMEDIIETLLGMEIMDESDEEEDMQTLARKNWEERARRRGVIKGEEPLEEHGEDQDDTPRKKGKNK